MPASSTERSRSKRCRTPAPSRSLCASCADPLLRVTSRIPRLASALRPSATSGCSARSAKPPSTCWTASSRSRSRSWSSSRTRSISPPSRANGSATPDTVRANPSRSNSANQICARCAGAPTSSNLAASGDMSDSVSLTSKTSSAGSRGPSELIGWSFTSFSSSAVGRGSRATARLPRPTAEEENEVKDHPINSDGPRLPALLVFDVNETLSDMSPLAARFEDVGAPAHLAQIWFAELLRDGFALTVSGVAEPFARLGGEMLRVRLDDQDLDLHPDVAEGLNALANLGIRLVTLSNGSAQLAQRLLDGAGVRHLFDRLLSVEEAGIWKPASGAYA